MNIFLLFRYESSYKSFVVPSFYISLTIISTVGQLTILIKKHIEHRRDIVVHISINQNQEEQNQNDNSVPGPLIANNKRWNDYLCNNTCLIGIIFVVAIVVCLSHFGYLFCLANHCEEDKFVLTTFFYYIILIVFIPASVYAKNDKLLNYVKTEIFHFE